MAITEGHIDVGTTSVQLDTTLVTQSTVALERSVHREVVVIGSPSVASAVAGVIERDIAHGLCILDLRSPDHIELLEGIHTQLRIMNLHLETMTGNEFTEEDYDDGDP